MIQSEILQEKKDGNIGYQTITTEYDNARNVTEPVSCYFQNKELEYIKIYGH